MRALEEFPCRKSAAGEQSSPETKCSCSQLHRAADGLPRVFSVTHRNPSKSFYFQWIVGWPEFCFLFFGKGELPQTWCMRC
jgi:hypothetical protein